MSYFKEYPYVDGFFEHAQTGKRQSWRRILRRDVETKIINPAAHRNCFYSVQRFADAVPLREQAKEAAKKGKVDPELLPTQLHYCGPFFDFDAKPELYDGKLELSVAAAQRDAISLVNFLFALGIGPPHVMVWFSGQKGFHVIVHPDVFAIKPHQDLTRIIKRFAAYVKEHLKLGTLDMAVYTVSRVWRIPNTIHQKTGLYKREIASNHLFETPTTKILEEAKEPGPKDGIWDRIEHENVQPEPDAVGLFNRFVEQWNAETEMRQMRPKLKVIKDPKGFPACVKDILENGLKEGGKGRNETTVALAAYFKDAGVPIEEAHQILCDWNARLPGADDRKLVDRNANAMSVLKTAYQSDLYRHSCRCMWALGGPLPKDKVACVGVSMCPTVNGKTPDEKVAGQEPENVPAVALNQVMSARFQGQVVTFAFHVSGKGAKPFIIPKVVSATCTPKPDTDLCANCRNIKFAESELSEENEEQVQAKQTIKFTQFNRVLLAMVGGSDDQKKGRLKAALGIPSRCLQQKIDIEQEVVLEQLRLIPLVDSLGTYQPADEGEDSSRVDIDTLGQEHTVVNALHMVEEAKGGIKANMKYKAWGVPYGSPQDQSATVLIYDHMPAQDDIISFKLDKDLHQKLKEFQVGRGQTVKQKWDEIHEDLEVNVHRIWGRSDMAMAIDIAYHSVLHFWFQGLRVQKGWPEILIIGDSGSGKTEMVKSFLRHYRLGEMTGVEGAKRTGLVYANLTVGGQLMLEWGKIPRNDGRLLFLDEFAGLTPEAIGEMTRLRSEGIAESQGSGQQTTWARTRLVLLTNPRNNWGMNKFAFGCEAVDQLFESQADMRRVDLAVGVRNSDISLKIINQRVGERKCEHRYNSDLCRKLVLWAWSRRERDITIDEDTTNYILEEAERLGNKYNSEISLVTGADQRLKLARLAVACAARLYSTDDDGKKVIVRKEHVRFIVELLERCYDDKHGLELNLFAQREAKRSILAPDEERRLRKEFREFTNWTGIREALFDQGYFRESTLASSIGYDRAEMQQLMKWLHKAKFVQSTPAGFRKTPIFIELLKKINVTEREGPTEEKDPDDIGKNPPY